MSKPAFEDTLPLDVGKPRFEDTFPIDSTSTISGKPAFEDTLPVNASLGEQFDHIKRMVGATFGFNPAQSLVEKTVTPINTAIAKEIISRTPMAMAWRGGKKLENMSRSGLNQLADFIPDPETTSLAGNMAMGLPKTGAKILAELAPSFISPEALALEGAGGIISNAAKSPEMLALGKSIGEKIPNSVKRTFTYDMHLPKKFRVLLDKAGRKTGQGQDIAKELGDVLSDGLSKQERLRLGQLIRGGVSESEKELPLRLRASYARNVLDDLEREAKDLDLIPQATLSQYTKKQMADLRLKKAVVDARIESLKTFGNKAKQGLLDKADTLRIQGGTGLVRKVESVEDAATNLKATLDDAKQVLTGEEFTSFESILSNEQLRRSKAVSSMVSRFERSNVAKQEQMFDRLSRVAERLGVKVDKIYDSELSIANFTGLVKKIEKLSSRFPGKAKMITALQDKSDDLQRQIADHYTQSGKKYMPRLYLGKEAPKETAEVFGFSPQKIGGQRFMKRADLSEETRMKMGEIREPAYPVAKGTAQISADIEKARLFESVAKRSEWVTSDEVLAKSKGFVKMPTSKRIGALSNQHVHPEIAREINEINRIPGPKEKGWDRFMGAWKFGKVVANPATHFRNIYSNSILMDLGGVSHVEQPRLLARAADELLSKGRYYFEAKKSGLLGKEFIGGELKAFRDALVSEPYSTDVISRSMNLAKKAADKLGDAYQGEEQIFKLAKFIKNRQKGMSIGAAKRDAEKWLFNYEKVSAAVKTARKMPLGSPFITFTSKALPRIAESAVTNPLKLYKYKLMFDAIEKVGLDNGVFTEKDREIIKRSSRGQNVILPMKGKDGKPLVLDLSYILPWGDIGESGGMSVGPYDLPSALSPGGPLKSALDVGYNKSTFNDREIFNKDTDTKSEKAAKVSDYILKALLPSLTPGVNKEGSFFKGGYSANRLAASINRAPYPRESKRGKVQSIPSAVASTVFGLKTAEIDPAQVVFDEIYKLSRQEQDIKKDMERKIQGAGISEAEKTKIINASIEKLRRLSKKASEL